MIKRVKAEFAERMRNNGVSVPRNRLVELTGNLDNGMLEGVWVDTNVSVHVHKVMLESPS